jgi:NAD-dependent dihydropyrimidine dehydrogenase PreA subunit
MTATLKQAMQSAERGLKVIIADGECMLVRQRRIRIEQAEQLKRGARVVKTRYGVDDELCTGDHSCIRLSGCPSLTVKPNPDLLRSDPVATVIESCVGCGLCGEVAHAAVLCPSFYRADIVTNPNWWDRTRAEIRNRVIAWLSGGGSPSLRRTSIAEGSHSERRREVSVANGDQGSSGRPITKPISILIAALGGERGCAARSSRSCSGGSRGASSRRRDMNAPFPQRQRPISIAILAMGGEGGGVLADWIVDAAAS